MPGLAAMVRAKYPGAYDDLDDAALEQKVLAKYPQYADLATPPAADAKSGRTWTDTAVDALPTVGGAVGGIVGGIAGNVPGGLGGAALGGAAGEAAKQLVNRYRGAPAPSTMLEAATSIGKEGAIQGAAELAGAGIGKGAQYVGGRLYNLALRPAAKITQGFGDVAGMGLKEGVPVSLGGAAKTAGLRSASAQAADQMAMSSGATIPTSAATQGFGDVAKEAAQRASLGMADDTADVLARAAEIQKNYPGGIPASVAQALKKTAQKSADTAFRTQAAGGLVKTVDAQLNKATATGLKTGIEAAVPGIAEQNAQTQTLMGLSKALGAANSRQNTMSRYLIPLAIGSGAGGITGAHTGDWQQGLASGALTAALMSPGGLSRAGIGLNRIGSTPVSQEAIRAALFALMQGQDQP